MEDTKQAYEEYLNDLVPHDDDDIFESKFIIGGKLRTGAYGTMLRRYDPIAFQVGYNDWYLQFKN